MTVEHTSPQPQQVAFILYVAGVNIPVNSVSVSYSFMSFPVMQFTLPADPLLIKLGEEDRVPVVVFYLDKWYTPHKSQKIVPTWRLLFDGDITSWNFSKSSASKMISFTAVAHMNTLNAMTLVYMTGRGSEILNALSQTNTSIAQKAIKEDVQSLSFFTKGAYGTGEIKRPIDFVKNLLLGIKIGGSP